MNEWGDPHQDPSMRTRPVIHLGEVAGVAQTLVGGLVAEGFPAEFRPLPQPTPGAPLVVKALSSAPRVSAAVRLRRELARRDAIAHVHFATAATLFVGRHPLVVHCHGSDVRNPDRVRAVALSQVYRAADLIIAATPDLVEHLPAGSRYLPNPVDTDMFRSAVGLEDAPFDVLVFAQLTDIKGAPELLDIVRLIQRIDPAIRISAIDHGPYADAFRQLGVRMVDFMAPKELPGFINQHRLVLGQRVLGVPGTSELQAMACGRPVVMPIDPDLDPDLRPPVVDGADPTKVAEQVVSVLNTPTELSHMGEHLRSWTVANHDTRSVSRRLIGWYGEL